MDFSGSAAVKSYSAMLTEEELKQEIFDGLDVATLLMIQCLLMILFSYCRKNGVHIEWSWHQGWTLIWSSRIWSGLFLVIDPAGYQSYAPCIALLLLKNNNKKIHFSVLFFSSAWWW